MLEPLLVVECGLKVWSERATCDKTGFVHVLSPQRNERGCYCCAGGSSTYRIVRQLSSVAAVAPFALLAIFSSAVATQGRSQPETCQKRGGLEQQRLTSGMLRCCLALARRCFFNAFAEGSLAFSFSFNAAT